MLDILCLANSIKYQRRCVAGIRLDTGAWIRPVSADFDYHGALTLSSIKLDDGSTPQILDVIRIGVSQPCPSHFQPENWRVNGEDWRLIQRPGDLRPLEDHLEYGPDLLGSRTAYIPERQLRTNPLQASLCLVCPDSNEVTWHMVYTDLGLRYRAVFSVSGQRYDLSVMDPLWRAQLEKLAPGEHSSADLGIHPDATVLLTISMGEPYNGACYKYVAAVIVIDWQS